MRVDSDNEDNGDQNASENRRSLVKSVSNHTKHCDSKQKMLTSYLLTFIVQSMSSFNVCNNQYFLDFIKALDPKFCTPNRVTMAYELRSEFNWQQKELKSFLASLTSDGWKSIAGDPYLVLTCHYIDKFCSGFFQFSSSAYFYKYL